MRIVPQVGMFLTCWSGEVSSICPPTLPSWSSSPNNFMVNMLNMRASLVAQRLKCLPPMWETRVWSLGHEDPLEKEMATHSSILAWRIPWTEEPGGLQSTGSQRVRHDWVTLLTYLEEIKLLYFVICNNLDFLSILIWKKIINSLRISNLASWGNSMAIKDTGSFFAFFFFWFCWLCFLL